MEKNTKKEGKIMEIKFNQAFVYQTIKEIMAIDSPSGFTKNAVAYVEKIAKQLTCHSLGQEKAMVLFLWKEKIHQRLSAFVPMSIL